MTTDTTRRRFIQAGALVGGLGVAGCLEALEGTDEYEIWAADQGTHTIYIYEPAEEEEEDDEPSFEEVDQIDTAADDGLVPHMVDYSSDYAYAAVACTAGARVLVYRTEDRELVGNIETGPGSHFAGFSPDDEYLHVDVIGKDEIVRVDADLDDEEFDIVDGINLRENDAIVDAGIDSGAPICHQYDDEGRSLHTVGPSYHDGALVIVDHEDFTVDAAFSGDELPTNCGTMPHPDGEKFYLTAGLPSDPEEGEDGVGDFYVFDTETDDVIAHDDTGGIDAHGFWWTPDHEELWVLNRETNDGVVIDPETDEVVDEIDTYGPSQGDNPDERDAPDIMWASPDGEYMFVTLRGPVPVSGDPHAATGVSPGFSVIDVESREFLTVVEPDPIYEYPEPDIQAALDGDEDAPDIPDFHGIGVRPLGNVSDTSPPF